LLHPVNEASIKIGDVVVTGTYYESEPGMLVVSCEFGTRTARVAGATAHSMAILLIGEMYRESRGKRG
jgi:hypothetical protein